MEVSFNQYRYWFYLVSFLASFNGGFINAITFESFFHNPVGYVTGNITFAALFIVQGKLVLFFNLILILISFFLGAIIGGLIVPQHSGIKQTRYRIAFIVEALLIFFGMLFLCNNSSYGKYFLASGLGLQNAITTFYGLSIIRTTHMTGTLTDLGIIISHVIIKKYHSSSWRIYIYIILLAGFSLGSVIGIITFASIGYYGLSLSIFICIVMIILVNLRF